MIRTGIRKFIPLVLSVFCLFAALPAQLAAQQPIGMQSSLAPSPAPSAPSEAAAAVKATLADFAWLAGRWQGTWGPRVAQQVWTAPKGGVMMGTFQLTENDSTLVLELFTLVEDPSGIKFRIRHFTPSLLAWEKPGPIVLDLVSTDSKKIVFDNGVGGQPKRAVITRVDSDTYMSRSEIVPEKGEMQVTEITYHRQKEELVAHHR